MVRLFESTGVTVVGEGIADEIGQWLQRPRERAGGHPSKSAKSSGE